jgi:hypothetical protein
MAVGEGLNAQGNISVVHGHSSHNAEAIEIYKNRLILYLSKWAMIYRHGFLAIYWMRLLIAELPFGRLPQI